MQISHQERPRELKWYHAGPMLYGDWGTSRFYVLGLAFYFALYESFWYIVGVGLLVAAVGWAYTVVCRIYPDGGGVYTAARQLSPLLSVIGALLLFADYAVTAALSAFDGMHYFGLTPGFWLKVSACASIVFLGFINYIGPKRAGTFALIIAGATLVLTLILVAFSVPHLSLGVHKIGTLSGTMPHRWTTLVNVVLALSGVEAIANMTGIMVKPVGRTSKQSIWPVLLEVVIFNIVLGIAMLALPATLQKQGKSEFIAASQPAEFSVATVQFSEADKAIGDYRDAHPNWNTPAGQADYEKKEQEVTKTYGTRHSTENEEAAQNRILRLMAEVYVSPFFGKICGLVFGLLLLSAVNTVIGGMMSVAYVMSRDTELPHAFAKLNLFGVPWVGLIPAVLVPVILLAMFTTLDELANLYAIGVVGAIAINLTCCTINKQLPVKAWERFSIGVIAAIMIVIEITLAVQKIPALLFVLAILAVGLGARYFTKSYLPARARALAKLTPEQRAAPVFRGIRVAVPEAATKAPETASPAFGTAPEELDMSRPHLMVATRGGQRLIQFSTDYAKQLNAILFVIYVRPWNVQFAIERSAPTLQEDEEAQRVFKAAEDAAKSKGVAMIPIYAVSSDVADTILDFAATYDVKALLMGVSRQATLLRALHGDVLTTVADQLPEDIPLLIHA